MALYTKLTGSVVVATDEARIQALASRSWDFVNSTLERAVTQHVEVGASGTLAVNLGSISTPKLLIVLAEGDLNVRTDAADGSPQRVRSLVAGQPGILMLTGLFTGVWLEAPGDAVAATIIAAGLE